VRIVLKTANSFNQSFVLNEIFLEEKVRVLKTIRNHAFGYKQTSTCFDTELGAYFELGKPKEFLMITPALFFENYFEEF